MKRRIGVLMFLVGSLAACGANSGGGGIDYGLPACNDGGYDPSTYSLNADFNGNECAFFFGIAKGGTVICECPQPGPMSYCGAKVPAFNGACPKP